MWNMNPFTKNFPLPANFLPTYIFLRITVCFKIPSM